VKNHIKYKIDSSWPVKIYGFSTGRAPIQVNIKRIFTMAQNMILFKGKKILLLNFFLES